MEPDKDEHVHPGLESMDWRDKANNQGVEPSAKYNKLSESARKMISHENVCAMFCGGKKCKYCTYHTWKPEQMEIDGLYSNWITDKILAMARPTLKAIKEKNVLDQLENAGIKAIINLQMPGEHASCGEGLHESGFSYDPQKFMERGIFYYNFGWNDFGVGSLSAILDIAKVMQFALSTGKVAVHCHAGLGRTGLMIACYLVFTNRTKPGDAVQYVRSRRPNSIQTGEQMQTVSEFEDYLKPFRIIYASKDPTSHEFSLRQFLSRQRHILHGFEGKRLRYLPKIVYVCCERLLELASKGNSLHKTRSTMNMSDLQSDVLRRTISSCSMNRAGSQVTINSDDNLQPSDSSETSRTKSLDDLKKEYMAVIGDENDKNDGDNDNDDEDIVCPSPSQSSSKPSSPSSQSNWTKAEDAHKNYSDSAQTLTGGDNSSGSDTTSLLGSIYSTTESEMSRLTLTAQSPSLDDRSKMVVDALTETDFSDIALKRVEDYETAFNETDETWGVLAQEEDPLVVSLLMWDWLDQLSEPVLSAQDLSTLMTSAESPLTTLLKVEKGVKFLLEYLGQVIIKLNPESHNHLLERLLSHLSHQVVRREILSRPCPESMDDWPKMRSITTKQLLRFFKKLMRDMKDNAKPKRQEKEEGEEEAKKRDN